VIFPTVAGGFRAILCDPPWHHKTWSPKGQTRRSPSHHYETMSIEDIRALPVADVAAPDCHLFLWVTQPHLELAFDVMRSWGFRYSSVHTFWVKLRPSASDTILVRPPDLTLGMGFTTRKNVELLLLGRRGSPRRLVKDMPDTLFAQRRQHSRKPDLSYERLELYCEGPRLELFARQSRPGWTCWGHEATKFDPAREAAE
jgi:N6-adenosine-specific RNA methylase IME4